MNFPLNFKAAILERNNAPLVIDNVTYDGPLGPGHVLVKIHYSGICGKQIEEIQGSGGKDPFLPHLLGHEGSGEVVSIGPGVTTVKPGDYVVLHWMKGAGIDAETPIYKWRGHRVNAGWITTFNEYGVIAENRMTVVPKNTELSEACLLGCAVTTGVGAVFNEARVKPEESVIVFGCGGVGLNVIQGASIIHAHPIIAVDKEKRNLEMARQFGATHVINSVEEDVLSEVSKITGKKGADYVFIAAANPQLMETAVESGAAPGVVYFVAVPAKGTKISIDALSVHRKRALTGGCGGGINPDKDIPAYLRLAQKRILKLAELKGCEVSLDDINSGVEWLLSGGMGRCIVKMG